VINITNPLSPQIVGSVDTPGAARGVAVAGTFAYVADSNAGLQVVDITNPLSPQIVANLALAGSAYGVTVLGDYAYIAGLSSGLHVIDISNPLSPLLVGTMDTRGAAYDLVIADDFAYIADFAFGLELIDISNPQDPRFVNGVDSPGRARSLAVAGDYCYLPDSDYGLHILPAQCPQGIHVNPEGTGDYPTIQAAIAAVHDGGTVILASGLFTGPGNRDLDFMGKQFELRSAAGSPADCIIDCQGTPDDPHRGFVFNSGETGAAIMRGITIRSGWAVAGGALWLGNASSPTIENCRIIANEAGEGGAIYCEGSAAPVLRSTLIAGNIAADGGGIYLQEAGIGLLSCTVAENQGSSSCIYGNNADIALSQSILAFNGPGGAVLSSGSSATLTCCDLCGNIGGDYIDIFAGQEGINGNISADPVFCRADPDDYTLDPSSICLPDNANNPCGLLIGAYGVGQDCTIASSADEPLPQARFELSHNHPNPFNPTTRIQFSLPEPSQISLRIYDLSGRLVWQLAGQDQWAAGPHAITWNGRDDAGRELPSGVYFYRLDAAGDTATMKMTLIR
jgi:hypothetical protein